MKTSLFSQSLWVMPLYEAIQMTAQIGFSAIELACRAPHLDYDTAIKNPLKVAESVDKAGLEVAALSLYNDFTNQNTLDENIEMAERYVRLAPLFSTRTVKMTPGPPGSREAQPEHWSCLAQVIERLSPVAREVGVRLAFETHMRQLTDTLDSSRRFLAMAPPDCVGLTVDFCNLAFAGEKMPEVFASIGNRMFHAHVKNGYVDTQQGGWHFQALDRGLINYSEVIGLLRGVGYEGYLSIECLGEEAKTDPVRTAARDLELLQRYLTTAT